MSITHPFLIHPLHPHLKRRKVAKGLSINSENSKQLNTQHNVVCIGDLRKYLLYARLVPDRIHAIFYPWALAQLGVPAERWNAKRKRNGNTKGWAPGARQENVALSRWRCFAYEQSHEFVPEISTVLAGHQKKKNLCINMTIIIMRGKPLF